MPRKRDESGDQAAGTAPGITPGSSFLSPYINKTVRFRFMGTDSAFHLSHALFSSFDIDEGTRRLLKSIALRVDLSSVNSCLDAGCGVGVIGICIQRARPQATVLLQDRDALAAAFAGANAAANGCRAIRVDSGLAFQNLRGEIFDLVASNLPAKAGQPVLQSFFYAIRSCLAPGGVACVVIVAPLTDLALSTVRESGAEIVHQEIMKDYAVLHFRFAGSPPEVPESRDFLSPYIRTEKVFTYGETAYPLRTAWSLPDFDTLSYSLQLSFDVLATVMVVGEVLAWNPGQGHIPAFLLSRESNSIRTTHLAARDCLELAITERGLRAGGHAVGQVRSAPSIARLLDTFPRECADFFVAVPQTIPRVPWQPELRDAARFLLKPGGRLFVVSSSTEMHRFLQALPGLRLVTSRKSYGFRAAVLQRL